KGDDECARARSHQANVRAVWAAANLVMAIADLTITAADLAMTGADGGITAADTGITPEDRNLTLRIGVWRLRGHFGRRARGFWQPRILACRPFVVVEQLAERFDQGRADILTDRPTVPELRAGARQRSSTAGR